MIALTIVFESGELALHVSLCLGNGCERSGPSSCSRSGFSLILLPLAVATMDTRALMDASAPVRRHVRNVVGHFLLHAQRKHIEAEHRRLPIQGSATATAH